MINLYIVGGVFFLILVIFVLIYQKGKNAKEKEIINNNNQLKKEYDKIKNNINSSDSLSSKLQKGNY